MIMETDFVTSITGEKQLQYMVASHYFEYGRILSCFV